MVYDDDQTTLTPAGPLPKAHLPLVSSQRISTTLLLVYTQHTHTYIVFNTLCGKQRTRKTQLNTMIEGKTWAGIEYRQLARTFDPDILFRFNKKHGSTPLNFIPDGSVRKHLAKISTGEAIVFGAFLCDNGQLVGFISSEVGRGYWLQTGPGKAATSFIHEFVVDSSFRGKAIGKQLATMSIDPEVVALALALALHLNKQTNSQRHTTKNKQTNKLNSYKHTESNKQTNQTTTGWNIWHQPRNHGGTYPCFCTTYFNFVQ